MEISNQVKLIALACVFAALVVGISVGGPKFVNALQMHFGAKGKIDLIDRCIKMPGCSIGPDDLDFYDRYHAIKESDLGKKIQESEAGKQLSNE